MDTAPQDQRFVRVVASKTRSSKRVQLLTHIGIFALAMLIWGPGDAQADELTISRSGKSITLMGEILIEAQDDSLLFEANDGQLWTVKPDEVKTKKVNDTEVAAIEPEQLAEELLDELPDGFRILQMDHYLVAYQTEKVYARWIANLYEGRLYSAFEKFWRKKKVPLTETKYPLVTIIFSNKAEYERYVTRELGELPGSMVAYYNLMTNRVAMYDLLTDELGGSRPSDERKLNEVLSNPRAIPMVATIIHEATHQLIFNRGLQQRLADTPLWLNEGLALYFEAPDLRNRRGWRMPGRLNQPRFDLFAQNYSLRKANAIELMVTDDTPFQTAETGLAAYADAWAFNHFLLNRRAKEFAGYLQHMSKHKPLATVTTKQRLADFQKYFGDDLERLERDFIKYMRKLR